MNLQPPHSPNDLSLLDGDRMAASHPGDVLRFEPVESRMLFSAAPSDIPDAPADAPQEPEVVLEVAEKSESDAGEPSPLSDPISLPEAAEDTGLAPDETISEEINAAFSGEAWEPRPEIVFISRDITAPEDLAAMLDPRLEVVFLDAHGDGMSQMAAALSGRSGIEAIHLVTHGSAGALHLGNVTLDASTLQSDYADEMAVIAAALSSDADILIYGCDFASGESGQAAAGLIASMTGADVAASTDTTGGSHFGGDWDLEHQTGAIEAASLSADAYSAVLAPPVWSISGSSSVSEGSPASYTLALTGSVTSGQTASVNLGVADLSTTSADYGSFVSAVNTAITGRSDLAFDGTTLTYTAPLVYTATHDTTSSGFNNISGTGTRISLADDSSIQRSIGFTFNFYGTDYTQLRVGSNGFLTFGGGSSDYTNEDFSAGETLDNRPAIAPLWDDWDPGTSASDDLFVQTIGSAGSRQFIVQWNSIVHFSGSDPVTFQVSLFEADGSIEFRYQDVVAESGWENGRSATIGVSDGSTRYSQFSFNTASIGNNQRITYTRSASMDPITISLPTVNDTTPEGTESFQISLSSPSNSSLGTSQVTTGIVDNDPAPPVAVADLFSINENNGLTSLGNALSNDSDPNLDTLTATPASGSGSNGGLYTIASNGAVTFNPNGQFESLAVGETATTAFNYTVNDGNGGSTVGQITVTVTGQNDAPTALGTIADQNGQDAQTITPLDLSGFFTDVDASDSLTFSDGGTLPTGLSIDANTGIVSGLIAANASVGSPYSVIITANDGNGGIVTQAFTWNVTNPAPTANPDGFAADEDDASAFIGNALTNDSDPDGDTLAAIAQTGIAGSNGGLFSIAANGNVTFDPAGDFEHLATGETATTSLTYTVSDGQGGTSSSTVTVTVTGENDAPTALGTITDQNGQDAQTITPLDLSGFFTDVDASDSLTFSDGGTLPTGLSIDANTGIVSGLIAANASVGSPYAVVITANDGNGGIVTQSFTWNVTNPAPTANPDGFAADEDDASAFIGNALTNDTDPDGDTLAAIAQTGIAGSNGGLFSIAANGNVTFDPNGDFEHLAAGETATTALTYTVSDGQGGTSSSTVTVTVTGQNDAPTALGTIATQNGTDSQTITPLDLSGFFTDVDASDALTFSDGGTLPTGLSIDANSGIVSGLIAANASGGSPYTVVITANDGNGGIVTQSFTWNVTNPAPTANPDGFAADEDDASAVVGNALTNDTDPDGDTLAAIAQTGIAGSNGGLFSIAANGNVTFDPNGDFEHLAAGETATTALTYTVSDGQGGTSSSTVTVTVTGENDAPTALGTITDQNGQDAQTITPLDLSGFFTDVDASDALTFSDGGTLPTGLSIDANTGIVSGLIAANASVGSPYAVVITANDGNGGIVTQSFIWNVTNPAPTANPDGFAADEDDVSAVVGNALTNDTDPDSDTLAAIAQTGIAGSNGGLFSIAANGNVTFDPAGDFEHLAAGETATTALTYTVSDGQGGTSSSTVTVTVTGENDAPTALGTITDQNDQDAQTITPLDLSSFFTDVDASDSLTFSDGGTLPTGLSIDANSGIVSGLIAANASVGSPYTVVITANDGNGGIVTQSFTWNVTNPAPTANPDGFAADEDDVSAVVGNALTNDTDPDGDTLAAIAQTGIAGSNGGLFSIAANGNVTFDPNGDFEHLAAGETATTALTYTVSDGQGGTSSSTVTVTVTGQNDAPTALGTIADQNGTDSQTITPLDLSGFFTDVDASDALTFSDGGTLPTGLSIDANTGIVSGLIAANASVGSPYTVVITANDGNGGIVTQSFTWNVTNPAPISNPDGFAADEDDASAFIGNALTNDTDPDGDTLAAIAQTGIAGSNGGLFSIAANGNVTFDPNGDFEHLAAGETATTALTYTVSDGQGGTSSSTVTVTVTGENDAPTALGTITTQNGQDAQTITPLDLSGFFTDVDASDALTFSDGGTLPTGLSIDANTGIVSGLIAANASVGSPYAVVITANDGNGGIVTQSFTWNVTNPAPTANPDGFAADEDDASAFIGNALTNDTDPDGDTLAAIAQTGIAGSNGGLFSIAANGNVTFDPNGDFEHLAAGETATTSLTYQISDGQGGTSSSTVTVTVTGENDAPTALGTIATQNGQDAQTITPLDLSGFFTDVDASDALTFSDGGTLPTGLSIDANSGIVSGLIAANASVGSPYTVVITANDGNGGIVTQSFTWNVTNPAPTANPDAFAADEDDASAFIGNALTNDTDPDGDTLAAIAQTGIAGSDGGLFSIAANGNVTFDPNGDFEHLAAGETATTSLTYTVSDGQGGTSSSTVTVTVTGENDTPVADDSAITVSEESTDTPLGLSAPADVDGDTLIITVASLPSVGTVTLADGTPVLVGMILSSSDLTGLLYDAPAEITTVVHTAFTYTVTDSIAPAVTGTATITVNPTNDAPIAASDHFIVDEDSSVSIDVLDNDSDAESDPLTISEVNGFAISDGGAPVTVLNGSVQLSGGVLIFTPAPDYHGPISFTYTVSDGTSTAIASVTGTVNPIAEAITLSNATAAENGTLTFTATLNAAAAGPFTVEVSVVSGTATAGTDIPATPVILTFNGTAGEVVTFTLTPTDDGLIENTEDFTLVMANVSNTAIDITATSTGTITDNDAAPPSTGPGTGVTTDIELVANGLGTIDLVIEDVETESALGFGSAVADADSTDNLSITLDGTDLVIRDNNGLWLASPIIGATRTANNEIRVPVSMVTGSIILRTGIGNDTVTIGNLGATLAGGLIINTEDPSGQFNDFDTITYNSSTTLADGFNAEFRADTITAQANSSLTATGTGSVDWIAGRNIVMQNGADVITEDGDITFEANLPGVRTGSFTGIEFAGASIQSTTGNISLDGRGGTVDSYNDGVRIGIDRTSRTGSTIATGGSVTIDGTGGTAGSQSNGVNVGNSSITGASVALSGTGGAAGGLSRGIYLYDADLASTSGDLTVHGTGRGNGLTSSNFGVATHANTTLTAAGNGAIDIRGTGGSGIGGLNTGVLLADGTAISVVDGDLTVSGTGGSGGSTNSSQNRGTTLDRATLRSTGAGDITIDGTGNGLGIRQIGVAVGASTIQATGTGSIDIAGTGSTTGSTMNHGLTVSSSTIQTAGGSIDLTGTGGGTQSKNDGIEIDGGSSIRVTAGAGSLTIAGTAGNGDSDNVGTAINAATLSTVNGDLSVTGSGNGTKDRNRGVFGTKVTATTTGSGSLTIVGTGSTASTGKSNEGITLVSSSTRATGTGNLTITGHGGRGNGGNHGILLNATTATSASGTTSFTGIGHVNATGNNNTGISLLKSSRVEGATLNLTGTGGGGVSKNYGLSIIGGSVRATSGSLTLVGQARATTTGSCNFGVWIENKVTLSATGAFGITGTGGGGRASNHGVFMNKGITAAGASVSGTAGAGTKSKATYGNYFA